MQLTQGRGIHNCCLCLFFIGKDFVYLDATHLYDHINRETFGQMLLGRLRTRHESNKRVKDTMLVVHALQIHAQRWPVSFHDSWRYKRCISTNSVPVAQWLEHCDSSAKVVGSIPREHILTKKCIAWVHCKSLWTKASDKCINVNTFFNKCDNIHELLSEKGIEV